MELFETAVILAGGKSRRMGFDKEFIRLEDEYLIYKNIEILKANFKEVMVVSNNWEFYKDIKDIVLLKDIFFQKGPLSGIHAGLKASNSQYSFFVACDMPNISVKYIEYTKQIIYTRQRCFGIFSLKNEEVEPFPGIYNRNTIPKLEKHLLENKLSIKSFLDGEDLNLLSESEISKVTKSQDIFKNLNTPDDLKDVMNDLKGVSHDR